MAPQFSDESGLGDGGATLEPEDSPGQHHIHIPITVHFDLAVLDEATATITQSFMDELEKTVNIRIGEIKLAYPEIQEPEAYLGI